MRTTLLLTLALAATAALPSCAQRRIPTRQPPVPAPKKPRTVSTIPINTAPRDTAFVLQRTGCHGTCPIYTATVFRDGRVAYHGERFVPVLGDKTFTLPVATVQSLLDEARSIGFTDLKTIFSGQVMDLPSTIVTVYLPGQQRHRVEARQDYPAALGTYIDHLRAQIDPLAGLLVEKK